MKKVKLLTMLITSITLCLTTLGTTAYADEFEITENSSVDIKMEVVLPKKWKVILPANVSLVKQDENTYVGSYEKIVSGDIPASKVLVVKPSQNSVELVDKTKQRSNIEGIITDNKIDFTPNELSNEGNVCTITCQNPGAGIWNGTVPYDISFEGYSGPGLYGIDGQLLKTLTIEDIESNGKIYERFEDAPIGEIVEVVIPDGATKIGDQIFWDCVNLESVVIPDTVTTIGDASFWNCCNLQNIVLPPNLTKIYSKAFYNCTSIEFFNIPNSVTSIGDFPFYGIDTVCYGGNNIFSYNNANWGAKHVISSLDEIDYNEKPDLSGITEPGFYDTYGNLIAEVPVSSGVVDVQNSKYPDILANTAKAIIPSGVTKVQFSHFPLLEEVILPNTVKEVKFYRCINLKNINLPESVDTFSENAFAECASLEPLSIPSKVRVLSSACFFGCTFKNFTIPNTVTAIYTSAFVNCANLESITIPNSVTSIGSSAFSRCVNLKTITLSNSITYINDYVFNNCINLRSIVIPSSVGTIGSSAFTNCVNLQSVEIPNTVTTIKSNAFFNVPHIIYEGTATGSPWGAKSIN